MRLRKGGAWAGSAGSRTLGLRRLRQARDETRAGVAAWGSQGPAWAMAQGMSQAVAQ